MVLKRVLFSILSAILMIAAMAFTMPNKSNNVSKKSLKTDGLYYYFAYIGPAVPSSVNDYLDPDNYILLTTQSPGDICDSGNDALCVIMSERYWNSYEWKPDLSDTSYYSIRNQLIEFYWYDAQGLLLTLKSLQ